MCGKGNEPGFRGPEAKRHPKGLAGRNVSGTLRVVCGRGGVWLGAMAWGRRGPKPRRSVRSAGIIIHGRDRDSVAIGLHGLGFTGPVPKLESKPGGKVVATPDSAKIAIRDMAHSSGAVMCKSLPSQVNAEFATPDCPECGRKMERHRQFGLSFTSHPGLEKDARTHWRRRDCGFGFLPLDRALGLEGADGHTGRGGHRDRCRDFGRLSGRRHESCVTWSG